MAGVPISPSLLGGVVLFGLLAMVVYWAVNSPKPADLLIETENEMRKVNWPRRDEAINSSVVVIATVIIFTAFIFVADYVLHYLMVLIHVYPNVG
jgi:preprotein translocase subunit SecE